MSDCSGRDRARAAAVGCDEVEAALYALIDCEECEQRRAAVDSGEIEGPDAAERLLLLAHATGCEHCADALEAERHLRLYLRGCFESDAPAGLESRIADALGLACGPAGA